MVLTQEQIDAFHKDGFLQYGRVLDDEELETTRKAYDAEFEKAWESNRFRNLSVNDGGESEEKRQAQKQMYQIMGMSDRSIHFRQMLYKPEILDVIEDLIGPNIMLFHDQALFKPAHTGGPVHWHQDNSYWRCRPANLVSVWIALDDAYLENGAMQVMPGSHLTPVWHERTGTDALQEVDMPDDVEPYVVNLKAGECMFHHCQTLHYTQPNETDDQRRAFIMHFMTPGTVQFTPDDHSKEVPMPLGFHRPMLRARA